MEARERCTCHIRKTENDGIWTWGVAGLAGAAIFLGGAQVKKDEPGSSLTPAYDLYIGFTAKTECVPKDGPYLTYLSYDFHVPRLRFNFTRRTLDGLMVNWFPLHGEGNGSSFPVLTFMTDGEIDCRLCPYQRCPISENSSKTTIKKAWFTRRDTMCQAVISVVPIADIKEVLSETLDVEKTKPLTEATVPLVNFIMHVKIIAHKNFTWTGSCTHGGQDAGSTGGLEFYFALPVFDLCSGRTAVAEFPFVSDDIDAKGTLTIRLTPTGSIQP